MYHVDKLVVLLVDVLQCKSHLGTAKKIDLLYNSDLIQLRPNECIQRPPFKVLVIKSTKRQIFARAHAKHITDHVLVAARDQLWKSCNIRKAHEHFVDAYARTYERDFRRKGNKSEASISLEAKKIAFSIG